MLELIFGNLFFISVGTLLIIVARSLPRMGELETKKLGIVERFIVSEIPERIDTYMNAFLFKSVRKMKVAILKMDNALAKHLERIKPGENGKVKPDFTTINGNGNPNGNGHTQNGIIVEPLTEREVVAQ